MQLAVYLIIVLGVGSLAARAQAQSAIRGSVRVDSTTRPVVGAVVAPDGQGSRPTETNSAGEFVLAGLDRGPVAIVFRAIGFRPFRIVAELSGQDTLELDVELVPIAQRLAPLAVTGKGPRFISATMVEFERRRLAGFGRFFTRAELAKLENGPLSNTLRYAAGLRLILLPTGCNSGLAVASGRIGLVEIPESMRCKERQTVAQACFLDVYLDGHPVWQWGEGPPPDINQFAVRDLQAMEVYRGRSELPIEFTRGEPLCGAIVMWGRTGER